MKHIELWNNHKSLELARTLHPPPPAPYIGHYPIVFVNQTALIRIRFIVRDLVIFMYNTSLTATINYTQIHAFPAAAAR